KGLHCSIDYHLLRPGSWAVYLTPYTNSPTIPFQILVSASLAPYFPSPTIFS
ncbi:hypothetical protein GOODEAATRI_030364, partial [Goodea atripinnis]